MSALASPCLAMAVRPRGLAISPPSRPATLGRVSPPSLRTPSRCSAPSRAQVIARANAQDNDVPWRVQWLALNENDVPTIEPEEAMRMVTAGEAVIVDVRVPADFDKSHALDAVNVPLFKRVDIFNTDLKGLMRFAVYSLNGVTAVEPNKDFTEQVVKAANGKAVILYCEAGGTMEPTPNFLYGKESRSLRGAYKVRWRGNSPLGCAGASLRRLETLTSCPSHFSW